jgi:hypothetical protein
LNTQVKKPVADVQEKRIDQRKNKRVVIVWLPDILDEAIV